ncbi:MAG TPA: SCO family protein [Vicinamibacterales bacterium]|nr:SCO family protein [Vicinamibacterales bacterium]
MFTRLVRLAPLAALVLALACSAAEPPRRYQFTGLVLAVHPDRREITIRHDDIEGLMPAMTMSFPVTDVALLDGRVAGDVVTGTLDVSDAIGRISALTKTGTAPLPTDSNAVALAEGLLDVGDEVPDAALIDQTDTRRSLSEWRGTPTLVTFIYTACPLPTFCPLMDQNFAMIQRAVAEDPALAGRVRLVSISFDPDRDTPAVLAAHAARLQADPAVWTWLTGDRVTVDRVAARFGVGVVRQGEAAGGEITHNLRTVLVGADGRVAAIYSGNEWTPGRVLTDLRAAVIPR